MLLAGVVWLLGAAFTIVGPLVGASIVATVAMPLVTGLQSHRVPRAAGAALVLVALAAIAGVIVVVVVIGGITSQETDDLQAGQRRRRRMPSPGSRAPASSQSGASGASASVKSDAPKIISTLVHGRRARPPGPHVRDLRALAGCALHVLPAQGRPDDAQVGRRPPRGAAVVGQTITGGVIRSLRGYFRGVTIVAGFNAAVVTLGALVLDVPLAGTIGVVTFVTAYVPFVGAFVSGAFAVVIALGAQGTTTALIMLVIVLLANGLLQNILQPFAMGAALDLSPLVVLVVTIAAGCLFGMIGLVLAAPLTSAAVHIMRELGAARDGDRAQSPEAEPPLPPPTPLQPRLVADVSLAGPVSATSPSRTASSIASPRVETPSLR